MNRVLLQLQRRINDPCLPDDSQLLAAFAGQRDADAFALLVRRHGPMVQGVCRRWLREPSDVDDAFQATFLVLVRRAGSISRPQQLANWLHGVAWRTARNLRTRVLRQQLRRDTDCDLAAVPAPACVADEEIGPLLDEEIERLPRIYRQPIVLCHLQGLSRRRAANVLGCPEGTLSARLSRGLVLLRHRLLRRGLVPAAAAVLLTPSSSEAVSPLLVRVTVQIAFEFQAAPVRVAGLAQGVLQMFFLRRLTAAAGAMVLLVALLVGAGLLLRDATGSSAHADSPAATKPDNSVVIRVSTDDVGTLRMATVTEGGDDVTVTTARSLGRYLKRVRRDLPVSPELTVLIERRVQTEVLAGIRKACTDAGFARLQVKSADSQPFELVEAPPLDQTLAATARALRFLATMQQVQERQEGQDKSATKLALLAIMQASSETGRNSLEGAWSVRQVMGGNYTMHFNKEKDLPQWIVVGDYLVTRDDGKYRVGRIYLDKNKDAQIIEFSYDADTPRHMMHRGTYNLSEKTLTVTFPGSPTWWRQSSLPEMLILERVDCAAKKK
jgi:RNA polymerase sigma factor (sigma-70 family)